MALGLEMEFAGFGAGWTDVTADLVTAPLAQPPELDYGISGVKPSDRTASTGTFTFTLRNWNPNGYYSLEHASKRSGFNLGIRVRLKYTIGATTYYKFIGRLSVATPSPSRRQAPPVVRCTAVDWIDSAARAQLTSLAMQTNKRADELLALVVGAVTDQPISTTFDTGTETYVLALDETVSALTELQKIAASEFGYVYIRGDTTGGGNLRLENRTNRLLAGSALGTFGDNELFGGDLVSYDEAEILNVVRAVTHPRTQDAAATTVLFTLQSTPLVTAGASITISGSYTDPNQRAVRVSGKDMVAPVATTDYLANSASNGSGTNLTANFTVVATYTGSAVFYTITNTGATDGYVTLLQARGRGVYDYQPVESKSVAQSSIDQYGQQDAAHDMPYQSDANIGAAVAGYVSGRYSTAIAAVPIKVACLAKTSALLTQVIAREVGDLIAISESQTGVNVNGFINHVRIVFAKTPWAEWLVFRAEPVGYWNVGIVGFSEMEVTTRLAPL